MHVTEKDIESGIAINIIEHSPRDERYKMTMDYILNADVTEGSKWQ